MITAEKLVELPMPRTGPVKINRPAILANFEGCKIIQSGGNFRLHSDEGLCCTLEPLDALWIIQTLALGVSVTPVMRRICIWQASAATAESRNET